MSGELSKRETRVAEALAGTVDKTSEVEALHIASELYDLGQRAWALRARIVDLRGLEVTFIVSLAMLELLRKHGLDLGAGPGGMFERGPSPDKDADTLFGIPIYSDSGAERHRHITLNLTDDGSVRQAPVDMGAVRGIEP